MVRTHIH